jgi:hypothetical protein
VTPARACSMLVNILCRFLDRRKLRLGTLRAECRLAAQLPD